jgi:hypothetical protein
MPRLGTQTVSTKVTEDDYALTAHLTGDQPVGEWIREVSTRLRPIARRSSSSLDGANGGLARRAPSGKAAVTPAQEVRRLADPAGFLVR